MKLTFELQEGTTILVPEATALSGDHVSEFKAECEPLLVEHCKLLVDLSAVQFLDSSACSALLNLHRRARERKGELRVCGLSPSVRALFEQLRIPRVIAIHGSRGEAIRLLNER